MSTDNRELKDQLDILFDDIEETEPAAAEKLQKDSAAALETSGEEQPEIHYIDLDKPEKQPAAKPVDNRPELPESELQFEPVDVEGGNHSFGLDDFGELEIPEVTEDEESYYRETEAKEPVKKEVSSARNDIPGEGFFLDGDDYEEDVSYGNDSEADEDDSEYRYREEHRSERHRERDEGPSADELRRESIRFWIFTAIIAIIVAASVLFILNRRGFIDLGFGQTTTAASSAKKSSTEATTTKATSASTTEKTTEPTTETTTEATTETSTEPVTESTTESTAATEAVSDASSVLQNYTQLFVIENTNTVNLRQEPSTDSAIIGILENYCGGELLEMTDGWCKVRTGGLEGYVKADFVKTGADAQALAVANAKLMVKTTAVVNVRLTPATADDSNILERANEGAVFEYLEESGDFYKVRYNASTDAYISRDFSDLGYYLQEASAYYAE